MFRVSYISKKKKVAAAGASNQPIAKKARIARGPPRISGTSPPPPQEAPALKLTRLSTAGVAPSGSGVQTGALTRQMLLDSPEAAWQKLVAICNDEGMSPFRGVETKQTAMDLNRGLFQTIIRSYAVFNQLGNTERALAAELELKKKMLTKLESAKDIASVAQAEREEIIAHERITLEENKRLKNENAHLVRERESLTARVSELTEDLKEAGSRAVEEFKKTDDFQELIIPVFLEGFEHAKKKISAALPDFDASVLEPGEDEEEEGEEQEGPKGEAADRGEVDGPGTVTGQTEGEPIEIDRGDSADPDRAIKVGREADPDRAGDVA